MKFANGGPGGPSSPRRRQLNMEVQLEHPADEIKRLQRCINDLVSVLALPAMWSGGEPSQIVHTLLDALLRMLDLDLVYVRLKDPVGEAPHRDGPSRSIAKTVSPDRKRSARCSTAGWEMIHRNGLALARNSIGDEDISIVPLPLGLQGEIGVIVAGSRASGFPASRPRDFF